MSQAKAARIEMRISSENKNNLQQAATISGVDLTSFVLMAALKEANKVIVQQHERTMSQRDQQKFFQILMADDEPTVDLIEAVRMYRDVQNG